MTDYKKQSTGIEVNLPDILFLDYDGTLSDGTIVGREQRSRHHAHDFVGLCQLRANGVYVCILSARRKARRALREIKRAGGCDKYAISRDKFADALHIAVRRSVSMLQCAAMGDDAPDVALLMGVGVPACPRDAHKSVVRVVKIHDGFVSSKRAGHGAVRQFTDYLLSL